jgi:multiple antibiotic resistance protein
MTMSIDIFLNALVAYFVVTDPLGVSLIFNGLTDDKDASYCRTVAIRAVALSFLVILSFGFFGALLLGRLGITMEAFRIAGGLLLFYTAFSMVLKPDRPSAEDNDKPIHELAVFPLSFPLIAGPGCLTLTILLFSRAGKAEGGLMAITLAIGIILGVMLIALLASRRIAGIIGGTANAVMKRILGVLLAALAVQFIADGVMGLIGQQMNGG